MDVINFYEDFDPTRLPIEADYEKSPHEALVAVIYQKDGNAFQMKTFPVNLSVFGIMSRVFAARTNVFRKLTEGLLNQLAETKLLQSDPDEEMQLIVKCICCNSVSRKVFAKLPDQSIGFMLTFKVDDPYTSQLWGGTKAQVEEAFNKMINKN